MPPNVHSTPNARILVVEDDLYQRNAHEEFFRGYGFEVTVCRTGREALAHLTSDDVDVMLLDLMLPELSGYEVLSAMRRGGVKQVPTIVVAASPSPLLSGALAVFRKPAPMMDVLAAVQRGLGLHRLA